VDTVRTLCDEGGRLSEKALVSQARVEVNPGRLRNELQENAISMSCQYSEHFGLKKLESAKVDRTTWEGKQSSLFQGLLAKVLAG